MSAKWQRSWWAVLGGGNWLVGRGLKPVTSELPGLCRCFFEDIGTRSQVSFFGQASVQGNYAVDFARLKLEKMKVLVDLT